MASLQVNFPQRTFPRVKPGEVVSASLLNFYSREIAAAYRNFRGGIFADSDDAPPPVRADKNAPWTISAHLDDEGKIRWDCIPGRIFGGNASTNYVVPEVLNEEPQDSAVSIYLLLIFSQPSFRGTLYIGEERLAEQYYPLVSYSGARKPLETTINWQRYFSAAYIQTTERCVIQPGLPTKASVREFYGGEPVPGGGAAPEVGRKVKSVFYRFVLLGSVSVADKSVKISQRALGYDLFSVPHVSSQQLGNYYAA